MDYTTSLWPLALLPGPQWLAIGPVELVLVLTSFLFFSFFFFAKSLIFQMLSIEIRWHISLAQKPRNNILRCGIPQTILALIVQEACRSSRLGRSFLLR